MHSKIVLGKIARSGFHFPHQDFVAHKQFQAGADAVTIALRSDRAYEDGVGAIASVVPEYIGACADVGDEDVQIAVVVEIADGKSAARLLYREAGAGPRPHAGELAQTVVSQQKIQLLIARTLAKPLDI